MNRTLLSPSSHSGQACLFPHFPAASEAGKFTTWLRLGELLRCLPDVLSAHRHQGDAVSHLLRSLPGRTTRLSFWSPWELRHSVLSCPPSRRKASPRMGTALVAPDPDFLQGVTYFLSVPLTLDTQLEYPTAWESNHVNSDVEWGPTHRDRSSIHRFTLHMANAARAGWTRL